jgi:hypothetical protein
MWVTFSALYLVSVINPHPPEDVDFDCPLPGRDSEYGSSTWQDWPPGDVCYDLDGNVTSRPDWRRGGMVITTATGSALFLAAGIASAVRGLREPSSFDGP